MLAPPCSSARDKPPPTRFCAKYERHLVISRQQRCIHLLIRVKPASSPTSALPPPDCPFSDVRAVCRRRSPEMLTRLPTHRQQTISAGFDPLIGAAEQCYRHRRAPLPRVQPGTHPGTLPRAAAAGWMGASSGSLQPPRPLSEYLCAASAADLPRAATQSPLSNPSRRGSASLRNLGTVCLALNDSV